jgi:hypothetical protein
MTTINPNIDLLDIRLSIAEIAAIETMADMMAALKHIPGTAVDNALEAAIESLHAKVKGALSASRSSYDFSRGD